MPDPISALVIGGSSIASGIIGSGAAKKAAEAQERSARDALEFQKGVFDTNQANLRPFISTGQNATYSLAKLYGLPGADGQAGGTPDYSGFYNSPDYNFAFDQGRKATQNVLSAQGNLLSGSGLAALTNFGQGLASQQYGNYFNRLLSLSNLGAQSAGNLAGVNANMGQSIGNTQQGIGQAQASGIVGSANAITGAINSAAGNLMTGNFLRGGGGGAGGGGNPSSYQNMLNSFGPASGNYSGTGNWSNSYLNFGNLMR